MTYLTRTDPTRNINRFYIVHVMPTLFGRAARMGPTRIARNHAAQQLLAAQ